MGLLSYFKRHEQSPAAAAEAPVAVVAARTRARRRLIGASLLLAMGVLGFPLLFETQPRPIAVDIPIEIPRKDLSPPLLLPTARPAPAVAAAAPDAPVEPAAAASTQQASPRPAESRAAPAVALPKPASSVAPRSEDGQRAQALLEGKAAGAGAASQAAAARMVVQIGAYSEPDKLHEARMKVEKLGMKTYTQVIESDAGRRTRVRVGPFATRDEAQKAAERIKAAGLPAAILTL